MENYILDHLPHSDKLLFSGMYRTVQGMSFEQKKTLIISTTPGYHLQIDIPRMEAIDQLQYISWIQYYLCAVFIRSLALGCPDQPIFFDSEEGLSHREFLLIKDIVQKYFQKHSNTLLVKASPINKKIQIIHGIAEPFDRQDLGTQSSPVILSEGYFLGLDVGAKGLKAMCIDGKGSKVSPLGFQEYQLTFSEFHSEGNGSEFIARLERFINDNIEVIEKQCGKVKAIYLGIPGVKAGASMVSLGQIARNFGDPIRQEDKYWQNIEVVNRGLANIKSVLSERHISFEFSNDMLPWAWELISQGISDGVAIISGGGQGQIRIHEGLPFAGNFEGGHQAYLPLLEEGFSANKSSPPGSYENYGLSRVSLLKRWLPYSGLEQDIKQKFNLGAEDTVEVVHLGQALDANDFLSTEVETKIWRNVARVEAEHIYFLTHYSKSRHFFWGGGLLQGSTGGIFLRILREEFECLCKALDDFPSDVQFHLIKSINAAHRAALSALHLSSN